ncbi:MAG: KamA family radical SAM protein [Treponemataceae bacterium]
MTFHPIPFWQKQLTIYRTASNLDFLSLSDAEKKIINDASSLPLAISTHYADLMKDLLCSNRYKDFYALRSQVIPSPHEKEIFDYELRDPLGGNKYKKLPRLIHQYKNRVLLITNGLCFSHCRYCFRKDYLSYKEGFISHLEIDEVCAYLAENSHIDEILLSGGDVLFASDEKVMYLIKKLRRTKSDLLIRICTRATTFFPERISKKLVSFFKDNKPLWVIPHINHPAEICSKTISCLDRLLCAGIPLQSQTVLLKDINDQTEILKNLFVSLTKIGVKAGYLFQCDLAQGISHFRVPLGDALSLYENLRNELSGLSLPQFALDLPNGGGKINLSCLENFAPHVTQTAKKYIFTKNGKEYAYPKN